MSKETKKTPVEKTPEIANINVSRIMEGYAQIGQLEIEDFNLNLSISRTIANLSLVEKAYLKSATAIKNKYIKKLDNGNFAVENNSYVFNSAKDKMQYESEKEKLDNAPVTEKIWILKTSILKDVKGIKATMMSFCHELIIDDAGILK